MWRAALPILLAASSLCAPTAQAEGWLAQLSGPEARDQLSAPDAETRRDAARTLGRHGARGPAIEALTEALRNEQDPTVRRAVARALARRGDVEAVPVLVEALRSGAEPNRPVVADALGALGTDPAVRALVDVLGNADAAPLVREPLLRVGSPAVPHLLRTMRDRSSAPQAAELLGRIGDPIATPRLVALATAEQPEVAVAALDALGALGDDRAADAVAEHLDHPAAEVRRAALRAMVRVGQPRHADTLAELGRQGPVARRRLAARALLRCAPKTGAELLEAWASSDDGRLVRAAADVALELPRRELLPLLYGLLREGSRAAEAASAISAVDGGAGVAVLLRESEREGGPSRDVARALAVTLRTWYDVLSDRSLRRGHRVLRGTGDGARALMLRALARDPEAGDALVERLDAERAEARAVAALGLQMLGETEHAAAVAERVAQEPDPEAFRRLAAAAGELGGHVAPERLWRRLEEPATAPEAMRLAALSLERATDRARGRVRELMRRHLRHDAPRVRVGAVWALVEANDRQAWRAIATRLDDGAPEVRLAAARALQAFRVEDATEHLRARWRVEPDQHVRDALERAWRAQDGRMPMPFAATGRRVLHVRIVAADEQTDRGVGTDVVLPDGRWLRIRTLPSGELFVPDLPAGDADVRVRVEP